MKPFAISFLDRTLSIEAPDDFAPRIAAFFALATPPPDGSTPTGRARITEPAPGRFSLAIDDRPPRDGLTRGEVIAALASELAATPLPAGAVALKAAAVGWNDKAILIVGPEGAGKSALAAWLIDQGFAYLADDSLVLSSAGHAVAFPGPLAFDPAKLSHVAGLEAFREAPSLAAGTRMLICPHPTWQAAEPAPECGLIIDVGYRQGAPLRLDPLAPDTATLRLLESTRKVVIPTDREYAPIAALAARTPVVKLSYGHFNQLDGLFDFLARVIVETETAPADLAKFLKALPRHVTPTAPKVYPIPARTERALHPKLTIGMATYDDFDGAYFTIQAIRMYHPEVLDEVEFVVIDNHPDGACAAPLKQLEQPIANYRYIPMKENVGTSASRERIFTEAAGRYVLCLDSHVLVAAGAIRKLLDYYAADPDTSDLLQGPVLNDSLGFVSTHYGLNWRDGFYGTWETSPAGSDPDAPPFEIAATGLGLFSCRRDAWPGFHEKFRGFGGEEGYIHEKFRRRGGRVLCLPFLRWLHRYQRPLGVPYPNLWQDRIRNYTLALSELGLPLDEMQTHYRVVLGDVHAERIFAEVARELADVGAD